MHQSLVFPEHFKNFFVVVFSSFTIHVIIIIIMLIVIDEDEEAEVYL